MSPDVSSTPISPLDAEKLRAEILAALRDIEQGVLKIKLALELRT